MNKTELDEIFDALDRSVRKTARAKKSPVATVADLQKSLDQLTAASGVTRVEIPVKKSAARLVRTKIVKFDPITKRAITNMDPLADENLGTTTARAVRKAEDNVDLYSGFVSRGQITGEHR